MAYGKQSSAALKKETTSGTAVIPNTFYELLSENISVDFVNEPSSPAVGIRSKMYRQNKGKIQAPSGNIKFTLEPKTLGHFLTAIYGTAASVTSGTVGSTTKFTHVFTETSNAASIPTYTLDFYTPDVGTSGTTKRYYGVRFGQLAFDENNGVFEGSCSVLAAGAFLTAQIETAAASAATGLTLSQTAGLVATDVLIVGWGSANEEAVTVSTIPSTTTITCPATTKAHAAGEVVVIKPATPSYSLGRQFTMYGGLTTGTMANRGGGSLFEIGTSLASLSTMNVEKYRFEFGQELEARHAARGYEHALGYPVAVLQKGYDAKVKVEQYMQDPQWLNYTRSRTGLATKMTLRSGNMDAATEGYELLTIETPEAYIKGHNYDLGNDAIVDEKLDFDCYYNATSGFVSRITLVTTVSAF